MKRIGGIRGPRGSERALSQRLILLSLAAFSVCTIVGQSFTPLVGGRLDLARALGLKDTCSMKVNSFEISGPITVSEYSAFRVHLLSLSGNRLTYSDQQDSITTDGRGSSQMNWVEATAYCQWLTQADTSAQWIYRLPHLLEWLYAMEAGLFDKEERGCWLLNAKDETGSSCQMPFYLYDCKDNDRLALRRKMVAFANTITHPKFGLDGNYWDFMHYPDVGFRVVRVQTSVGGR